MATKVAALSNADIAMGMALGFRLLVDDLCRDEGARERLIAKLDSVIARVAANGQPGAVVMLDLLRASLAPDAPADRLMARLVTDDPIGSS